MYVYKTTETGWEVGHYTTQQGETHWHTETLHKTQQAAIQRVNYLNGGTGQPQTKTYETWTTNPYKNPYKYTNTTNRTQNGKRKI